MRVLPGKSLCVGVEAACTCSALCLRALPWFSRQPPAPFLAVLPLRAASILFQLLHHVPLANRISFIFLKLLGVERSVKKNFSFFFFLCCTQTTLRSNIFIFNAKQRGSSQCFVAFHTVCGGTLLIERCSKCRLCSW
uniref:Uncharacterized protein n=1 Tax=Ixodes ricinus TaxID=34613 RepID=A0A6B0UT44_IXORI